MKKRKGPEWFNFSRLVSNYYIEYFRYYIELNPEYLKDMRESLFPAFLAIYGNHHPSEAEVYTKDCFYQAMHLVRQEDDWFYLGVRLDLKSEEDEVLKEKCFDFAQRFRKFISKYRLYQQGFSDVSNHALAHTVYFAIYIGEPNVLNPGEMLQSSYPDELLDELWKKYSKEEWIRLFEKKIKWTLNKEELDEFGLRFVEKYKESLHTPRYLPPAEPFQFFPAYDNLLCSSADYERIAVSAFRQHIQSYLRELKEGLAKHGIKRYKAEDPIQIQRLVIWNQHSFKHLWEIIPYIPEFSNVLMGRKTQVESVVDKLRKSFRKLEKFNMPVRPFGPKRKNFTT